MEKITDVGMRNFSLPKNMTPEKIGLEFEALLFSYLFKGFEKLIPSEKKGFGNDVLMPILEMQLSKSICENANFGFKNLVASQLEAKELYESCR